MFENHTIWFDLRYPALPDQAELCLMKKILITGATGKVGSRFASRILAKGYDVRILVRDAAKASAIG